VTKPYWLQRRNRKLPKTVQTTIPKYLIFYDTETEIITDDNGIIHFPLRLGVARYIELNADTSVKKEDTCIFYDTESFIEFVLDKCKKKKRLYLFAHNAGFDIRVLDLHNHFNDRGFTSEPPIINNRVFIWDVKTSTNTLVFLDTANYGVISVDKLGSDMGYDKLDVDFNTVSDEELITYCKRDVEILEKFMYGFIVFLYDNNLGAFRSTIASQAFNTYRYRFMKIPPTIHTNEKALALERDSYYGGRVECRFIGDLNDGKYYYVDFNSMYPYVMLNLPVPHKFRGMTYKVSLNLLKMRVKTSYVIAKVLVKTDEPAYAIKLKGKLVFPIGTFKVILHQPDLKYALEQGHILYCYECSVYDARPIFSEYVDFFYHLKQLYTTKGNKSWRYITKLFLNSLYGKFGQRETTRKIVGESESDLIFRIPCSSEETEERYQYVMWFGVLFKEFRLGETAYSCPAIAASITSYARHRLWHYLKIAGLNNVYYMDTDSYIVNQSGYDNLTPHIDPSKLGYLAVEDTANNVRINGNKDYVFGDVVKHKGLPKTAIQLSDNLWEYTQFQGFITWMNNGAKPGMIAAKRTKRRLQTYNKGIVNMENGTVSPLILTLNHLDS